MYSSAFNTHQMVCDCATTASSLLNFTQQHFVAITLHAETNFIGDLFFIFAAFYVWIPSLASLYLVMFHTNQQHFCVGYEGNFYMETVLNTPHNPLNCATCLHNIQSTVRHEILLSVLSNSMFTFNWHTETVNCLNKVALTRDVAYRKYLQAGYIILYNTLRINQWVEYSCLKNVHSNANAC